jgi:diadenosine tetraphosphate (Ap4A) HIT family hydrolase
MKIKLKDNKELETADVPWKNPIREDYHVAVFKDEFPVSMGHLLFVPKYNTPEVVKDAFYDAYQYGLALVKDGHIDGFNIGLNYGETAGQTVMYPHVHLIPRYEGDVKNPRGGVRNVIPGKGNY